MKKTKSLYLSLFFFGLLCSFHISFSQQLPLIHLKKEQALLFFQKGAKSDTLTPHESDLFYLSVPDSLKSSLSIYTENGRLERVSGDTLVRFTYLKGLKYESLFVKTDAKTYAFQSLINGPAEGNSNSAVIRFFDKKSGKTILENVFYYRGR